MASANVARVAAHGLPLGLASDLAAAARMGASPCRPPTAPSIGSIGLRAGSRLHVGSAGHRGAHRLCKCSARRASITVLARQDGEGSAF